MGMARFCSHFQPPHVQLARRTQLGLSGHGQLALWPQDTGPQGVLQTGGCEFTEI